jgi:serine/threonine-protein phosphatase 2B catalytic subunit
MCSYFYGIGQSKSFLEKNKLKLIIRGHEVENTGFKYQKQGNGRPLALTIFSAPNYCDSYRNKGAVLYVSE